jgi:hypothetical protein
VVDPYAPLAASGGEIAALLEGGSVFAALRSEVTSGPVFAALELELYGRRVEVLRPLLALARNELAALPGWRSSSAAPRAPSRMVKTRLQA